MKKISSIILFVLLVTTAVKADQWTVFNTPHTFSVSFADDNTGFIGGYSGLWKTTNAGETFVESPGTLNGTVSVLLKNQILYVISTDLHDVILQRSTNLGLSWQFIGSYMGPLYVSDDNQIMVGEFRSAYYSENGLNYHLAFNKPSGPPFIISGMAIGNSGHAYIATRDSFYFSYNIADTNMVFWWMLTNGGITCRSSVILNDSKIYIGGDANGSAVINSTTDEGHTWASTILSEGTCREIIFDNSNNGYAIVNATYNQDSTLTKIYKTIDGSNWERIYQLVVSHQGGWQPFGLCSISITDQYVYFGGRNQLVRYEPDAIGINDPGSNIPKDYKLYQNYPNPFNPVTKISYQIPKNENISLKIFDISGKEVATLVNEKKQAGSYEVSLDGSNLSSGIYFYKLTADDFTETKKMMLIK